MCCWHRRRETGIETVALSLAPTSPRANARLHSSARFAATAGLPGFMSFVNPASAPKVALTVAFSPNEGSE